MSSSPVISESQSKTTGSPHHSPAHSLNLATQINPPEQLVTRPPATSRQTQSTPATLPQTAADSAEPVSENAPAAPETSAAPSELIRSRAGEQLILAALCTVLLLWAGWRWLELSHWGSHQIELERLPAAEFAYVVDLNTANWLELALLDGVGEVLGKRIVEHRETHGPFSTVDELRQVKGIGAKTLEKLRPQVYAGTAE